MMLPALTTSPRLTATPSSTPAPRATADALWSARVTQDSVTERRWSTGAAGATPTFCTGAAGCSLPLPSSAWESPVTMPEPIHAAAARTTPTATRRLGLSNPEAISVTRLVPGEGLSAAVSRKWTRPYTSDPGRSKGVRGRRERPASLRRWPPTISCDARNSAFEPRQDISYVISPASPPQPMVVKPGAPSRFTTGRSRCVALMASFCVRNAEPDRCSPREKIRASRMKLRAMASERNGRFRPA